MTAPDPFAWRAAGRRRLVAFESDLLAPRAKFDLHPLADDEAYAIADQCRDLERRINETAPQTAIGAAVKLRQVLWIADSKWDALADDEITSLRQLLAFVEATP